MLMALQAGASGLTFAPVPGLIGSDLMRVRDDFRTVPDPFNPAYQVAVVPAITPDFALIHASRALPDGSLVLPAHGDAPLLAQAARFVIATVEEVLESEPETIGADERVLPGIYVNVIAPAPRGAHPLGCRPYYGEDHAAVERYVNASRTSDAWAAYLEGEVISPANHAAYLEKVLAAPVGD